MIDTKLGQWLIYSIIAISVLIAGLTCFTLFAFIIKEGIVYFNLTFIVEMVPAMISTTYLVIITLLFACPIGFLTAIYLKLYAKSKIVTETISFIINCLAAIPSIVYGLFAVSLFLYFFRIDRSIFIAGITIGCLILPIIIKNIEDAISNVSKLQIDASYALGATTLYTITRIILPNSIDRIVTILSLSIGRIVGDVAAIMFVMGTIDRIPNSIFDPGISLATKLFLILQEPAFSNVGVGEAYAIALVLILFIVLLNVIVKVTNYLLVKGD